MFLVCQLVPRGSTSPESQIGSWSVVGDFVRDFFFGVAILYHCVSLHLCSSSSLCVLHLPDCCCLCIIIILVQHLLPSLHPCCPCTTSVTVSASSLSSSLNPSAVAISASALLSSLKPSVNSHLQSVLGQCPLDIMVCHGCAHIGLSCRHASS